MRVKNWVISGNNRWVREMREKREAMSLSLSLSHSYPAHTHAHTHIPVITTHTPHYSALLSDNNTEEEENAS